MKSNILLLLSRSTFYKVISALMHAMMKILDFLLFLRFAAYGATKRSVVHLTKSLQVDVLNVKYYISIHAR